MRDCDLQLLTHFLKRPGIYTGEYKINSIRNIDKFLMAYEFGANGECNFREKLSSKIVEKFGIHMPSEGLIKQFKLAALELDIDWYELFIKEGEEILKEESDKGGKSRYANLLRERFLNYLTEIPEEINCNWTFNWNSIVSRMKEWNGNNLDLREQKLIIEISEGMEELITNDIIKNQIVPTLLIGKMNELVELLNKKHKR